MTESENKRSRRRFLADVLFIGGGISAAAILAKTQIFDKRKPSHPPDIMGEMIPPEPPPHPEGAAPVQPVDPTPQGPPPMPGEAMPVQVSPSPQSPPKSTECPPDIAGKPVAPRAPEPPQPQGGP